MLESAGLLIRSGRKARAPAGATARANDSLGELGEKGETTQLQRTRPRSVKRWEWLDASSWDEIAGASPGSTWFHKRSWSETTALHDPRFEARAAGLRLSDGEVAAFPLVVRRGMLRRGPLARAVSTQPGTYGGPVLRDRLLTPEDWIEVFEVLGKLPIGRIDCFGNVDDPFPDSRAPGFRADGLTFFERATHVVQLTKLPEDPRSTYRRDCRAALRKAEAAGVTCRRMTTRAELEAYYAVYHDRLQHAWGKSEDKALPIELFQALMEAPGGEVWGAYDGEGEICAGGIFLFTPQRCVWWQGALRTSHARIGPSKALIHHMILEARSRGCAWLDMNPSSGISGVEEFKRGFRASELRFKCWRRLTPLVARLAPHSPPQAAEPPGG